MTPPLSLPIVEEVAAGGTDGFLFKRELAPHLEAYGEYVETPGSLISSTGGDPNSGSELTEPHPGVALGALSRTP